MAFALPILSQAGNASALAPRLLVLEPTRELAAQVETAIRDFARFTTPDRGGRVRGRGLR